MKTRYFILATLAMAGLAVSCAKSQIGGETPLPEEEAPVPIQLTTNLKVNSVSVTKAGVDTWAGQELYIYALPTNQIPDKESADILVNNAMAYAPTDVTTDPYGKKNIVLHKGESDFYYYPADKTTLDFYGYYVDKAFVADPTQEEAPTKPDPTITQNDNISLKLYLDGSQDIMLAKADKIADTQNIEDVPGAMIAPANAYSAYSARKKVKPNLKFQHLLSRFVFNVVAGNAEGAKVEIKKVTLTSLSEATLVIANLAGDTGITVADPAAEPSVFTLAPAAEHTLPCFPHRNVEELGSYDIEDSDRIGESIMVIPAPMHKMVMTMQQMNGTGVGATALGDPFTYEYDLVPRMVDDGTGTKPEAFLPGYQYNVNVVVYGREKVEVQVTLTEWADGGSITIDNDKEWGDEPKLGLKATNEAGDEYYLYFYGNSNVIAEGMEVKYWDKNANKMAAPAAGIYMFVGEVDNGGTSLYGVDLVHDAEGNKTTVSRLITEAPNPETPPTD